MGHHLRALASLLDIEPPQSDTVVGHIRLDSRSIKEDDIFVALAGRAAHGLDFAHDALKRGARLVLSDKADERIDSECLWVIPQLAEKLAMLAQWRYGDNGYPRIVAITGTNGKTSVAWFIAQLLKDNGINCGYIGTLGAGSIDDLRAIDMTTPDVFTLHRILGQAKQRNVDWMSIEASSHALDQGRLDGVCIEGGVFTTFSQDHLDYHQTMEHYFAAKARLMSRPELKWAIVNSEVTAQHDVVSNVPTTIYGLEGDVPFSVVANPAGLTIDLTVEHQPLSFDIGLFGRYQGENLTAALIATSFITALPMNEIAGISSLCSPPGRMEIYSHQSRIFVVDYAHTPHALEMALVNLREHNNDSKLWVLVGCAGDRDEGKRPMMGGIAEQFADEVIITNDNPRNEEGDAIASDILKGMANPADHRVILDRREAIVYTMDHAAEGDVVLIAGKGHEAYQEIKGERYPFSDQHVLLDNGAKAGVAYA